jgi:hypothetical protein
VAPGYTHPPNQWVPGRISPRVKEQGRETDHSPPSSAKIKNGGVITPLPPYTFLAKCQLLKHKGNFITTFIICICMIYYQYAGEKQFYISIKSVRPS